MDIIHRLETVLEWGGTRRNIIFLCISGIFLAVSFFDLHPFPFDAAWIAIVFCGLPIILEAVLGLATAFDIKADVLVSLALVASVIIGEDFAAGEVAFIMQIGALLEDLTVAKARAGIEKLVRLTPQTARVVQGQNENIIPANQVVVGDMLRVLPGETVPVDGIIREGETSINQAVMTGESLPVDKTAGDEVVSGTVNQFGAFIMEATRVGEDSSIQRMVRLVRSADAGKAKIVRLADRWATWIVVIALTSAALAWLVTGEVIRAVTILVVFCPCALVLATPTAIMAAIGNATRHGFLVREGDALERLSQIGRCAFDKTGTLTSGTPRVVAVKSLTDDLEDDELYRLAAGAELLSEHPLGKAVVRSFRKNGKAVPEKIEEFHMIPGRGVSARVEGHMVMAGNLKLLRAQGISDVTALTDIAVSHLKNGCTVIHCAVDGKPAGCIALADTLREDGPGMVGRLRRLKVATVLLTGDHETAARQIAGQVGIDVVRASCLPEDKLHYIEASQKDGIRVCMIGDGINDAPALKKAHVSIAMGGVGSDIAVDAADIALVHDEIREIPHLVALARRTMLTIKCNLAFSMGLNFVAIILAMTGVLNPVIGALVHNAGSVVVIINSALLLHWRRQDIALKKPSILTSSPA
ncbi:cation-translocating P-type ATPase [uncultured Desulfovibrio sp.]|uniref:heavy metal translocating P-type ATPase n=1 Tax=uncultured Desulfovibrio sp. TaxID=167968 RepID=UPI0026124D4B|nr:cation-translocating P-type ATPase [uncultured Desulfovibrio sp.]